MQLLKSWKTWFFADFNDLSRSTPILDELWYSRRRDWVKGNVFRFIQPWQSLSLLAKNTANQVASLATLLVAKLAMKTLLVFVHTQGDHPIIYILVSVTIIEVENLIFWLILTTQADHLLFWTSWHCKEMVAQKVLH